MTQPPASQWFQLVSGDLVPHRQSSPLGAGGQQTESVSIGLDGTGQNLRGQVAVVEFYEAKRNDEINKRTGGDP